MVVLGIGLVLWIWQPEAGPPPRPPASFAELIAAPQQADWRWRRFASNEAVLVIEFPSLAEQGRAMNRLAALHEKSGGKRDRVLNDAELAALIEKGGDNAATFFMGHDYPVDKLARFFTLADAQGLVLNAQEQRLRDQLLAEGMMRREADRSYTGIGTQALVSFTALQADDPATPQDELVDAPRRASVLRHELSHGEFFTVLGYRQQCMSFWQKVLTDAERARFRDYLASIDYDPSDEELMANEAQALLLHTPDARAFKPADVGLDERGLEALRERFRSLR